LTRAARCFADGGDHARAGDASPRAQAEYDKTVLRRAGKFIKNFFDRE
jgi:hypothetical protein